MKAKKAGGMAQMVKCLPHKCKALNSIPTTAKKKNKTKQKTFPSKNTLMNI
jgi:phage FluMu protein Com